MYMMREEVERPQAHDFLSADFPLLSLRGISKSLKISLLWFGLPL